MSTFRPIFAQHGFLTSSPAMDCVLQDAYNYSQHGVVNVVVMGETGTGKDVLACAMHRLGSRSSGPLITVACGAIPIHLAESLLFGHDKRAYTGAGQEEPGWFEAAKGGTIVLSDVDVLPEEMQVKLLGVVENRRMTMVSATHRTKEVDCQIIATSNRPLNTCEGFRKDLLYRLGHQLEIPPLRERPADIVCQAMIFLELCQSGTHRVKNIDSTVINCFLADLWPDNSRGLRRIVEGMVIRNQGMRDTLTPALLPRRFGGCASASLKDVCLREWLRLAMMDPDFSLAGSYHRWKEAAIDLMMLECKGNQAEVGRRLGIDSSTLSKYFRSHRSQTG